MGFLEKGGRCLTTVRANMRTRTVGSHSKILGRSDCKQHVGAAARTGLFFSILKSTIAI